MTTFGNEPDIDSAAQSSKLSTSLLQGLRLRSPEAWRCMANLYTPVVHGWVQTAGVGQTDAADIVQEVFAVVATRIDGFTQNRADSTFRGWLWRITRYKIGDYFRKVKKHPTATGGSSALEQWSQLEAANDDTSNDANEGLGPLCQRGLAVIRPEIRETTWQAFWRVVVEDQPPRDVAESLGVSLNSVYLARSRVLRRLREVLGDQDE